MGRNEDRKTAVIREVRDRLRAEDAELTDIDGVRVNTPDGWWLLRASNTQDVLVARCEAGAFSSRPGCSVPACTQWIEVKSTPAWCCSQPRV